jgi:NAD(P)-dependent dehydrogenase (short-subunit alcohol dehydrogenase family)
MNSDPQWKYAAYKLLGYSASKAALNMLTVQLAAGLQDTGIEVNAVNPGFTATALNHHKGTQTLAEGAAAAIRADRQRRRVRRILQCRRTACVVNAIAIARSPAIAAK